MKVSLLNSSSHLLRASCDPAGRSSRQYLSEALEMLAAPKKAKVGNSLIGLLALLGWMMIQWFQCIFCGVIKTWHFPVFTDGFKVGVGAFWVICPSLGYDQIGLWLGFQNSPRLVFFTEQGGALVFLFWGVLINKTRKAKVLF